MVDAGFAVGRVAEHIREVQRCEIAVTEYRDLFIETAADARHFRLRDPGVGASGWVTVVATAPGHVKLVGSVVIDTLTSQELAQFSLISAKLLGVLDPEGKFAAAAPVEVSGSRES